MSWARGVLTALVATIASAAGAADLSGRVTFAGGPVPGATVTATKGETRVITTSNAEGSTRCRIWRKACGPCGRDAGVCTGRARDYRAAGRTAGAMDAQPAQLRPECTEDGGRAAAPSVRFGRSRWHPPGDTGDSVRTWCASRRHACVRQPAARFPARGSGGHGSVSRGFAARGEQRRLAIRHQRRPSHQRQRQQRRRVAVCAARGFGNNRRGAIALQRQPRVLSGSSAWDARPFRSRPRAPKPDYNDVQLIGTFGGPHQIPGLRNRPNLFVGYQRTDTNATTAVRARADGARAGRRLLGGRGDRTRQPLQLVDPRTGQPFTGNAIPADRISPQASALLDYYPQPNLDRRRIQLPAADVTPKPPGQRAVPRLADPHPAEQPSATLSWTARHRHDQRVRVRGCGPDVDARRGLDHSNRLSQFLLLRTRYQLTRTASTCRISRAG